MKKTATKRKTTIKFVESKEPIDTRLIAETIARKILEGGVK